MRKSEQEKLTLRQDVLGSNGERIREEESAAIKKNIISANRKMFKMQISPRLFHAAIRSIYSF